MKYLTTDSNGIRVEFDLADLITISSALNEVCNGIDLFEFETRIGADKQRVLGLLSEINSVIDSASGGSRTT